MLQRYLYRFGYQPAHLLAFDDEDSQCVWIVAENESDALEWGREISEHFVADRWTDNPSWMASDYAHWIETNEETLQADANSPCCNIGEFPVWADA